MLFLSYIYTLKGRPDRELHRRRIFTLLRIQREPKNKREGAHGRKPSKSSPRAEPQVLELDALVFAERVSCIEKDQPSELERGCDGEDIFDIEDQLFVPADQNTVHFRAERTHIIAPDRADASHEIAFKDRKPVSLDSLTPSGPRTEMHRRIPDDRDVHARVHLELHEVGGSP